jgi:multidrug transporter EmrE-like cation transporter
MALSSYILLLTAIALGVAGQLLLKFGMLRQPSFRLAEIGGIPRNGPVVLGFGCYGLSVLLYLQALANLDLSLAYPTVSLGYVLVIIMSRILFKEVVTPKRWTAVMIICFGVVLVGFGSA